jgi:hypothetical protein
MPAFDKYLFNLWSTASIFGNGSPGTLVFFDPRKLGFVLGFPVEALGLTDLAGFEGLSDFLGPLIEKFLQRYG